MTTSHTAQIAAQKTMEKKDLKLKETETLLAEEITPNMTKLKQERSSYIEFQKTGVCMIRVVIFLFIGQ
jgi:hypothetical protein